MSKNKENCVSVNDTPIPLLPKRTNPLPALGQRPVKSNTSGVGESNTTNLQHSRQFKRPRASSEPITPEVECLDETQEIMASQESDPEESCSFEEDVRQVIQEEVRKWIDLHADPIVRVETRKFLTKQSTPVRVNPTAQRKK